MTTDQAREALEQVIRSHSANMLHLERITAAWRNLSPTQRMVVGEESPELAAAIVTADANR